MNPLAYRAGQAVALVQIGLHKEANKLKSVGSAISEAAKKNPLLTASLAVGGTAGAGVGAHQIATGNTGTTMEQPQYQYPRNPLMYDPSRSQ